MFNPLVGHTDWVRSVSFSPDGKKLASGSNNKAVIIWDVETSRSLATLKVITIECRVWHSVSSSLQVNGPYYPDLARR